MHVSYPRVLRSLSAMLVLVPLIMLWPARGETAAQAAASPAVVELSHGVRVELIGVSDYRGGPKRWWGPDGSALKEAPCGPIKADIDLTGKTPVYALVFRVTGAESPSIRHTFSDPRIGGWQGRAEARNGRPSEGLYAIVAGVPSDHGPQMDLQIGVNNERPRVLASYDFKGTGNVSYADGGAIFLDPYEENGQLVFAIAHTDHRPFRETGFVVYDANGEAHDYDRNWYAGNAGFIASRVWFKGLKRTQVTRIELQARCFEWAAFRNISLASGRISRVDREAILNPNDRIGTTAPSQYADEVLKTLIGKPVGAFELKDPDGKVHRLADYDGRPVLIDLWATWCPTCLRELPLLARLQRQYAGKGLVTLAISHREQPDVVSGFLKQRPLELRVLVDETASVTQRFATARGSVPLPTTILLDRSHKVVYACRGFTDEESVALEQAVKSLLGAPGAAPSATDVAPHTSPP